MEVSLIHSSLAIELHIHTEAS